MNSDMTDVLSTEPTPARKRAPKATTAAKAAKKPSKAVVTKPAAKAAKKAAKPAPAKKARVAAADDVSTTQPDDSVVLKAVAKLKEPTLASAVASGLGVHRRVIRAQLIRLSKEKANGVVMKKSGFNWYVSHK